MVQGIGTVEKVILGVRKLVGAKWRPRFAGVSRFFEIQIFLQNNYLNFEEKPHPAKGGVHSGFGFSIYPIPRGRLQIYKLTD